MQKRVRLMPSMLWILPAAFYVLGCSGAAKPPEETPQKASRRIVEGEPISTKIQAPLESPPKGPFGFALITTADGKKTSIKDFQRNETCAECHPRQWKELEGSMHSIAHVDTLYRKTAELALVEAGEEVYTYCSGCHTPQGVSSRLVPQVPEEKLPKVVKAGVICDSCHQISALSGAKGPWHEPGNASFVLRPDADEKLGPPSGNDDDADHGVASRPFFRRSEFCASCHTVIHPGNGVRIEHTYGEWKKSVYAEKGIQCQDCHMRTVAQARQVAATMKPIIIKGKSSAEGKERPIGHHFFVAGNANAHHLGGSAVHAKMAVERLKSAAQLELVVPQSVSQKETLRFEVIVKNTGAGHSLPTSLTELREIWVDLNLISAAGRTIYRSGWLEKNGDIEAKAMRFGAHAGDKNGKLTYKAWEVTHFIWKRLIAAKSAARDAFVVPLPRDLEGPLTLRAKLMYRNAPPKVVKMLFGDEKPTLVSVEMASAEKTIPVR